MRDVVVLAIIAGFFLLCVAYVAWCDHIIGPDPDDLFDHDVRPGAAADADADVAASAGGAAGERGLDAEAVRS